MNTNAMTKAERSDLLKVIRSRERLAKTEVKEQATALKADFERQLDTTYSFNNDEVWAQAEKLVANAVAEARTVVAEQSVALGIPRQFAPSIGHYWSEGGRQLIEKECVKMRRVAHTRIDAMAAEAHTKIERWSVETQTNLIARGLTSEEAQTFLEEMPRPDSIMVMLTVNDARRLLTGC
jgi:hypothetical protein